MSTGPGGTGIGALPGNAIFGLERGSTLEQLMSDDDRRALAVAAGELLAAPQPDASRQWIGRSGLTGELRLGATYLVGLDSVAGAPIPAPAGIDTATPLAAAGGNLRTLDNTNVRLAPSTTGMAAETLPAGTIVRAYGYAPSINWYLVGMSDAVIGYVFGELLEAVEGGDPVLAGGSPKAPRLCRDVALTMQAPGGTQDAWTSLVCQGANGGWLVPTERGLS